MESDLLDVDQKAILYVYSLYSCEKDFKYLQYTAALVIFYYLMKKDIFPDYHEQLLVYDYKDSRRFLWEDKKFMTDINDIRDYDFLSRARLKTVHYRDINAHQCTLKGKDHLEAIGYKNTPPATAINKLLYCRCGSLLSVCLHDKQPVLECKKCGKTKICVENFLYDLKDPVKQKFSYSFI